jgi:hypothetical protein
MTSSLLSKLCLGTGLGALAVAALFTNAAFSRLPSTLPQPQRITCVNNLKQIGLGFKTFETDHGRLSFHYSTNEGGTRELCGPDSEGFDRNAAIHFAAISNELTVPLLLICPQDSSRNAARAFDTLRPENVTYRLRTGFSIEETNPSQVLAFCPIHQNTLHLDGSVSGPQAGNPEPTPSLWQALPYLPEVKSRLFTAAGIALIGAALIITSCSSKFVRHDKKSPL